MKIRDAHNTGGPAGNGREQAAFTLVEVMIASTIFLMVVGAVLATNLFGIRVVQITEPKLSAGAAVRLTTDRLVSEITSAKIILVGSGDVSSFVRVADGAAKQGSALQLYPSTDTNVFIRYFWDAADKKLKRVTNGTTNALVVAAAITNSVVFTGQDSLGNILTNNQNNMVIGVTLQYFQLGNTNTPVGPASYYKSYQLKTRVVHRPR